MNIRSALANVPPAVLGMVAAKWASKRFAAEGSAATETDPESWTWSSYLKGAIGAFAAGFIAQNIRAGWGQKVLEGGMNLMVYKLIQNELIPKNEWASNQFGEQSQDAIIQYDQQGRPYMMGEDGNMYPMDERHRLPETMLGDMLEVPGRLGDALEVPGRLGDAWTDSYFGQDRTTDVYAKAFLG